MPSPTADHRAPIAGTARARWSAQSPPPAAEAGRGLARAVALALLTSLAAAFTGCGTGGASTSTGLARARARIHCPAAPSLDLRTASATSLVPDSPRLALVCRYIPPPLGRPHRVFSLAGQRWATDPARVERLARLLDRLPPIGNVATSCPALGGRTDLIVFVYPGREPVSVRIEYRDCIPVTNGRVVRHGLGLPFRESVHWPDEGLLSGTG